MSELETLRGHISAVRFVKESGWGIAVLDTDERERVTIVGTIRGVAPGDRVSLEGVWDESARFGLQFRISHLYPVIDTSPEELVKYFLETQADLIGPVLASRIFEEFGERTFEVLENDPDGLLAIPGIGNERLEAIKAAWEGSVTVRLMMGLCAELKIGLVHSTSFLRMSSPRQGEEAIQYVREVLEQRPYSLLTHQMSWTDVDDIALRLGFPQDDISRVAWGCWEAFRRECEKCGHTRMPEQVFVEKATPLLSTDDAWYPEEEDIMEGLSYAVEELGILIDLPYSRAPYLTLSRYYRYETTIARRILNAKRFCPPSEVTLEQVQDLQVPHFFDDVQAMACRAPFLHQFTIITGGPGTGKTTITRHITQTALAMGLKVVLLAPTGKAADRLSNSAKYPASTVHRALGLGFGSSKNDDADIDEEGEERVEGYEDTLVLVDESSMLDSWLLYQILDVFPPQARILLVGDREQLPPVGVGSPFSDLCNFLLDQQSSFYSGDSDSEEGSPLVTLKKVYRQGEGSTIPLNAAKVNVGDPRLSWSDDFTLLPVRRATDVSKLWRELRKDYEAYDIQILSPIWDSGLGVTEINRVVQELRAELEETKELPNTDSGPFPFREGDRVMCTRNDYGVGVMNGEQGIVTGSDGTTLLVDFGTSVPKIVRWEWGTLRHLVLCYCMTVHKSQGSQYPAVILVAGRSIGQMAYRALFYTAITRAEKRCFLMMGEQLVESFITNNRPTQRDTLVPLLLEDYLEQLQQCGDLTQE